MTAAVHQFILNTYDDVNVVLWHRLFLPVPGGVADRGVFSSQFLWAAGTQQRLWRPWRCKWTRHYTGCSDWFVLPASSGSLLDSEPPPQTPAGPVCQVCQVCPAAADQPVFSSEVQPPKVSSPPTGRSRLYLVLAPVDSLVAGGTSGGIRSFGCQHRGL